MIFHQPGSDQKLIINLGLLTVKNEFFTAEKTQKKSPKAINSMKIALTNFNINTHVLVPSMDVCHSSFGL